jgi:hypothetical protein
MLHVTKKLHISFATKNLNKILLKKPRFHAFPKDSAKTNTLIIAHPVIHRDIAKTIKSKKAGTQPKLRNKRAQKTNVLSLILKFFGRFDPALTALQ